MSSSIFSGWVHDHPFYSTIYDSLKWEIDVVLGGGDPIVALLLGPSGAGKTDLTKDICGSYPDHLGPNGHAQVMLVETPTADTGESLPSRIIKKLLGTAPPKSKKSDVRDQAQEALCSAGVKVLFIDEVNHIVEARSTRAAQTKENRQLADWFKELVESGGISLVLVGLPHIRQLLLDNEQLKRRALRPTVFQPYNWVDQSESTAFAQAVAAFAARFREREWLVSVPLEELVPRAYACSGGLVGLVKDLFASAELLGARERNLSLELLSHAYERWFDRPQFTNPFEGNIPSEEVLNRAYQLVLGSTRPLMHGNRVGGPSWGGAHP
jgi:hypothetical protein